MKCPNWRNEELDTDKDNQNNRKDEPNNRKKYCKFYLWEKHDAGAREPMTTGLQDPLLPRTPRSDRKRGAERVEISHLPTPNSDSRGDGTHKSPRRRYFQSPNQTPTRQRYNNAHTSFDCGDSDLSAEVIALLQEVDIRLPGSTEVRLRHIINLTVDSYETRIRRCSDTAAELSKKLAETEGSGS